MGLVRLTETAGFVICVSVFSAAICAEETAPCAGLEGSSLTQCESTQQTLRLQQQLEQQLQQQQERQKQLDKQQREVQQQLESMRLQNESLRKQLERETANQAQVQAQVQAQIQAQAARPVPTAAVEAARSEDVKNWKTENPWFGTDYNKTQFAMRYVKQLQKDHPDLSGRPLLDAVSTKVNETFGASH